MSSLSSSSSPVKNRSFQKEQIELSKLRIEQELLSAAKITPLSDEAVKAFVTEHLTLYPVYERYGEKVFKESSILWRALTYIPIIPYYNINISGFESYKKLGEDRAELNMIKFRAFLPEAISEELKLVSEKISAVQISIDVTRNDLE